MQYAFGNNTLVRFGADYEGTNNSYNAPAFTQLDAGVRIGLGDGWAIQGAVGKI